MDDQTLEIINLELAVLVRHITSITSDKKEALDRSAYLLLHQISAHGSAGVKALADEFHLDISTVSRQIAALEKKGYVYRISDPQDGRASYFHLSDSGSKVLLEYKKARMARITEKFKDWTDEECQSFGQLLRKFNHTFH